MRLLFALLMLASLCVAQFGPRDPYWRVRGQGPQANRPAACIAGRDVWVCNGSGCSPDPVLQYCTSTDTWTAFSGGGSGLGDPGANGVVVRTALNTTTNRSVAGTANEITITNGDGTGGNPTASIASEFDISGKTSTKPIKAGTTLPATCSVGEFFFKTDAVAGQNLHACTATNTWTPLGSVSSGAGRYAAGFTAQTSITVAGTTHGLGTCDLGVSIFDGSSPAARIEPDAVTCDGTSKDVVITFSDSQTGRYTLLAGGRYAAGFTAQTSITVTGGTHGMGSCDVTVTAWDNSSPAARVEPDAVTCDGSSKDIVITFTESQTGRYVIQ